MSGSPATGIYGANRREVQVGKASNSRISGGAKKVVKAKNDHVSGAKKRGR